MAVLRSVSYVAEVVLLVSDPELWMYVCMCVRIYVVFVWVEVGFSVHAISRNSKYMAHKTRVVQPCSGAQVRLSGGETGTITNTSAGRLHGENQDM